MADAADLRTRTDDELRINFVISRRKRSISVFSGPAASLKRRDASVR